MSFQSIIEHASDGTTVNYTVPFPYISDNHVFAYDMGETPGSAPLVVNIDHWNGPSEIVLDSPLPVNHILRIQRVTPVGRMEVEYTDASFPTEYQLNLANTQLLFLIQEQQDAAQAGQFIALVDHRSLSGLLEPNQHNIQTINGLQAALDGKAPAVSTNNRITAVESQASTNAGIIAQKADKSYTDTQLAGKAAAIHNHAQADITGLESALQQIGIALNGKAPNTLASASSAGLMSPEMWTKVDGWTPSEVPLATTTLAGIVKPDGGTITVDPDGTIHSATGGVGVTLHSALTGRDSADCHPMQAVTGLLAALADKATAVHSHPVSEVTGLTEQLAAKVNNTTLTDYVTNIVFNTAVDAKADRSFVEAALAEKAPVKHNHDIGGVNGLQEGLDGKANAQTTQQALDGKADAVDLRDMAYADDAPTDGKTYGRKDGTWSEGTSGVSQDEFIAAINAVNADIDAKADKTELSRQYIMVSDTKPSGTPAGTFTAGAWRTRDINTVEANTLPDSSLSDNQVHLPGGKYLVDITAPAYGVNPNKARLTTSAGEVLLVGTSESSWNNGWSTTQSRIKGVISLPEAAKVNVQHYCTTTVTSYGFGQAIGIAGVAEKYLSAVFEKIQ